MMARAVNQVLKHLGIRQCKLIGHSMGGYVCMEFAWLYPRKVAGLCLFHSHAAADSPEAKVNRNRTIKIVQENKQGFVVNFIPGLFAPGNINKFSGKIAELSRQAAQTSKEGVIAALEGMKIRQDRLDVLAEIGVPVLFIAGKQDTKIPLSEVLRQAALPAHSEVLILNDVGHMGFIEAGEKTYKAIRKFIDN